MSQQIKVENFLVFRGAAQHMGNVKGNFSFENQLVWYDDFCGKAIDNTYDYTVTADSGNTATIAVPHALTLTNDANDEGVNCATAVTYYGQYNACCEARIALSTIASTHAHFGFIDAQNDQPPVTYASDSISWTSGDAAIWFYDKDATTEEWLGGSVKNTATGAAVADPSSAPVNGAYQTFRIELRDNGTTTDALFYINTAGEEINPLTDFVYMELDAVTRDTALCVCVGVEGRNTGGFTAAIDYIKIWQDRS